MNWNIVAVTEPNKSTVWELWINGWKRSIHQTWYLANLERKRYQNSA